jgi:hypothetical protein
MRKRGRERKITTRRRYIERTTEEVMEKEREKAFSEHTQEAFSALRDARGLGVARG